MVTLDYSTTCLSLHVSCLCDCFLLFLLKETRSLWPLMRIIWIYEKNVLLFWLSFEPLMSQTAPHQTHLVIDFQAFSHLRGFSRAGLSHHQHHPVLFDQLNDLLLALMHRQGASERVQVRWTPPPWHHGNAVVQAPTCSVLVIAVVWGKTRRLTPVDFTVRRESYISRWWQINLGGNYIWGLSIYSVKYL